MKFITKEIDIFDLYCIRKFIDGEWYYLDEDAEYSTKEQLGYDKDGFKFYRKLSWVDYSYMKSEKPRLTLERVIFEALRYKEFFQCLYDDNLINFFNWDFYGFQDATEACMHRYSITDTLEKV